MTDPASTVREPLAGEGGGLERQPTEILVSSTADATGSREVMTSHG